MYSFILKIFVAITLGVGITFLTAFNSIRHQYNCCDCKSVPIYGKPLPFVTGRWQYQQEIICRDSGAQCKFQCEEVYKKNFLTAVSLPVYDEFLLFPVPFMIDIIVAIGASYIVSTILFFFHEKRHHVSRPHHTHHMIRLKKDPQQIHQVGVKTKYDRSQFPPQQF